MTRLPYLPPPNATIATRTEAPSITTDVPQPAGGERFETMMEAVARLGAQARADQADRQSLRRSVTAHREQDQSTERDQAVADRPEAKSEVKSEPTEPGRRPQKHRAEGEPDASPVAKKPAGKTDKAEKTGKDAAEPTDEKNETTAPSADPALLLALTAAGTRMATPENASPKGSATDAAAAAAVASASAGTKGKPADAAATAPPSEPAPATPADLVMAAAAAADPATHPVEKAPTLLPVDVKAETQKPKTAVPAAPSDTTVGTVTAVAGALSAAAPVANDKEPGPKSAESGPAPVTSIVVSPGTAPLDAGGASGSQGQADPKQAAPKGLDPTAADGDGSTTNPAPVVQAGGSASAAPADATAPTGPTGPTTVAPIDNTQAALNVGVAAPAAIRAETVVVGKEVRRGSDITDQVVAQVGRQLQNVKTLADGTHHTVLRLNPEHLGEIVITLDVRGSGVRLDLQAGGQALNALQADLGRLRDDLAGSGLDLGDVSLHSQDTGSNLFNGRNPAQEQSRPSYQPATMPDDGRPFRAEEVARAMRTSEGGLDVLA